MAKSIPESVLKDLKREHGEDLNLITVPAQGDEYLFVTKPCASGDWKKFKKLSVDPEQRHTAVESLARMCLVYMQGAASISRADVMAEFDKLQDSLPGVADSVGSHVAELAGMRAEAHSKKL